MQIEMIAVGDELLDGRVCETNSYRLSKRLRELGHRLRAIQTVPDDEASIAAAFASASARGGLIIASGGLGITEDDRTRAALSRWSGRGLVVDAAGLEAVQSRNHERGRAWRGALEGHAVIIEGGRGLHNPVGLAVGIDVDAPGGARVVALPGVPAEFDAMLAQHLSSWLQTNQSWSLRQWSCFGRGELGLEAKLTSLQLSDSVSVGLTAGDGVVGVTLSASEGDEAALKDAAARVEATLAPFLVTAGGDSLAEHLGGVLTRRGESLASSESCTGGLIGHLLTEVAGSSAYFTEAAVTYSNDAKMRRLGVRSSTLERFGAVSRHVVLEMVHGLRERSGATWGVATSGVAGPGGGSAAKPVGLVHIAVEGPGVVLHRAVFYPGRDRSLVKRLAANAALSMLIMGIEGRALWPTPALPEPIFLD